ncbi:MAG: hypothetical protein COZ06_04185 [Armatimonadetes bacterium CG_4_10_14_3_um_filter_66_18]|nr:DUF433 domain-containing protein [Armatimonadota bacterium]OIO94588.1 MAG: hypothetical protein AUJ96_28400 [Armatimonadetes bacterium CG2_30_66_41]PIU92737.1 MAG: hypothetical protein COS65_16275 [Armatimonadetes bacterium CG06_land_8_20_14_3_00_66_21]PIX39881.1 MAG: hypothetical protein COZ57_27270 [Armatimonadetes bacterium CG_4_8_14_3_um_filter_66_20]PIY51723.1 MAG: hypothetical protein COZ06_04185 [Armatimonadetes bacterium CG_4_10_14_3_um_filter_66_18]PIZ42272.1 MAG: hypothetical prot
MQLEDYFDFQAPNDIRIKGHRIGIETVLYDYIHRSRQPEEIVQSYPTLTLEEVHATILYYLHNKEQVDRYLTEWLEWGHRMREEQKRNPTPLMLKIRQIKAEQLATQKASGGPPAHGHAQVLG